jgi:thiol-disulfide isomerase/thioredoxin
MKRKNIYLLILVLIAVAVALLVAFSGSATGTSVTSFDNKPVPESLLSALQIPESLSSSIGIGLAKNIPNKVTGASLTINGKPEILYVGAEFCPYCAIERWSLVIALSRFGSFSGLEYMTSSSTDSPPSIPTFTFANATYSSPYVAFAARELYGNKQANGSYVPLQSLNSSQQAIFNAYDSEGAFPFTDFANKSIQIGANYNDLTILAGKNWSTIAGSLNNVSATSGALVGTANLFTAEICNANGNVPASVCSQGYIQNIEKQLG